MMQQPIVAKTLLSRDSPYFQYCTW